nr:MAG TPA: hypothetical protein [Caudoviricetes sp.]
MIQLYYINIFNWGAKGCYDSHRTLRKGLMPMVTYSD